MNKLIFLLVIALIPTYVTAQQTPSLTPEEQQAVRDLKTAGIISYYKGAEQIVSVDPDVWNRMSFQSRKTFTVRLCIYVNRYVRKDLTMDDWWIRIENMATGKKMAKWDNRAHYKEF